MRLDEGRESGNVEDRRGKGMQVAAVGGLGTLAILLIGMFLGIDPQMLLQNMPQQQGPAQQEERELTPDEKQAGKFASTVLFFTEEVWTEQFRLAGEQYKPPRLVLFSSQVDTGCGTAPSAVGPFYCPADESVYLDPTFFNELKQLGGSTGEFSQAYVIAHEVGHHIQNLLGYSKIVDGKRRSLSKEEFNKWSVRLELQADYLAGVWAHYGQKKFRFIEPGDVEAAIKSANAIGDDSLQKRSTGFTSPENYTHGTSAQRVKWFNLGLKTGDMSMLKKIFDMPYGEL